MTRTRRALSGSAVLLLQVIIRLGTVVLLAPLMLRFESQETLGAYSVILQLVTYVQMLELGMGRAISRALARGSERPEEARRLAGTSLSFLALVGIVTGTIAAVIAWTLPLWFSARADVLASSRGALLLSAAWMPMRFPLSFFHLRLYAIQRVARYGAFALIGDILRSVLSLAFVWMGWGLIGLAAANILPEVVTFGLSWLHYRKEGGEPVRWGLPDMPLLKDLLKVALPLSLMSLGDRLTFFSQDMIAGGLLGASAVGAIYATRMPGFTLGSVLWRAMDSVSPGLNELHGKGLRDGLRSAHHRLVSYTLATSIWAAFGIYAFNRPIVETWVGTALFVEEGLTGAVAFLIFVATLNCVLTNFIIVAGRLSSYPAVVFGSGLLAVALSLVLGRSWGASGILWGAALANLTNTAFLVHHDRAIFEATFRELFVPVAARAFRCCAIGVSACLVFSLSSGYGVSVPWPVGLTLALAAGVAGFIWFGLLPADRAHLASWLSTDRIFGKMKENN